MMMMTAMRRILWVALLAAAPLGAQGTRADTTLQRDVRQWLDTIARDKSAPGYSKRAQLKIDSLTRAHLVPIAPPVNRPPVAIFTQPATGCILSQICTFTSQSTDDKAVVGQVWDCGVTPNCNSTGLTASVVYSTAGNRTVSLTVRDAEGLSSTSTRSIPVVAASVPPVDTVACATTRPDTSVGSPAELPRAYVASCYPTIARRVSIPAGGNLQTALDTAKSGDELALAPGATYTANLTWTRCLAGVVVVTGLAGPPEGTRATPTVAAANQYPKLVSPNISPVLTARTGACGLRFSRVEVTATPQSGTVNYNYGLIRIGDGETTLDLQPSGITLDRVYVHGTATTQTQNAVILNGRRLAVVDSWISNIYWQGTESHCVAAWTGAGPLKVVNNTLSCASIDMLIGGAARAIANVAPSDVEVRRNYFTKDTTWKGKGLVAKNLFEVKDGARILLDGNVIEHSWTDAQSGMAVNLQSLTDEGNTAVQATDITVRWNSIRDAGQCVTLSARGYNGVALPMTRVALVNNLCTDIGVDNSNRAVLMTADLGVMYVRHNTFVRRSVPRALTPTYFERGAGPQATRVDFNDNIIGGGMDYPCIFGEGKSGSAALTNYAAAWSFVGNGCWDSTPGASAFPSGNGFVATQADVGFLADWSLGATSPWKGKASDGKDPGVDAPELARRLTGVVVTP